MGAVKTRLGTFFKRGLRALLPTLLTFGVLVIVYNFFANNIVGPVNRGIDAFLVDTRIGNAVMDTVFSVDVTADTYRIRAELPPERKNIAWARVRSDLKKVYPRWLQAITGFLVALSIVFVAGFILATLVGRRILGRFESAMARFPVVKVVYPYARQVVEFFMRDRPVQFNTVVALEYPRHGLYSIGFVTGRGMKELNRVSGETMVNIFIPSCPTPITGYVIFVPAKDVIPLPITVDQAIRLAISGGVLIPEHQQNPEDILDRFQQIEPAHVPQEPEDSPEPPPPEE